MNQKEYEDKIKELEDTINRITLEKEELELVISTLKEHIDDIDREMYSLTS